MDVCEATVADAVTELLINTFGTEDGAKKLAGKFNVMLAEAEGVNEPPAVVLNEKVTAEAYF